MANFLVYRILDGKLDFADVPKALEAGVKKILVEIGHEELTKQYKSVKRPTYCQEWRKEMRYMKHMAQTITDNYNAFVGTVIAVISVIFGEHWYLFALFLALNIADWVTGWMK